MEVLDRLLPIVTLLIGSGLTWLVQRSQSGYERRLAAGELLSDMRRQVWTKDDDGGWADFQVYLGRLRVHLREVGVPERVIRFLSGAANDYWQATEFREGVGLVLVDNESIESSLDIAEARVHMWLRTDWRSRVLEWRRRRKALRWTIDAQERESRS